MNSLINCKPALKQVKYNLLNKHQSCAIIGGSLMGKASLLKHLKEDLLSNGDSSSQQKVIPVYVKLSDHNAPLQTIYEKIWSETVNETIIWLQNQQPPLKTEALDSLVNLSRNSKQSDDQLNDWFLEKLHFIITVLEQRGHDVKIIFLLDKFYTIGEANRKKAFAQRLQDLLLRKESDKYLGKRLHVVLGCRRAFNREFGIEINPDTSDLIAPVRLQLFDLNHTKELIEVTCGPSISVDMDILYKTTGGHPGILTEIVNFCSRELQSQETVEEGIRYIKDTYREQFSYFLQVTCKEYKLCKPILETLYKQRDKVWQLKELQTVLNQNSATNCYHFEDMSDLLELLTSSGIVYNDFPRGGYQAGGEIFQEIVSSLWHEPQLEQMDKDDRAKTHALIQKHYTLDDLKTLSSFKLGIRHENLKASTIAQMARELIEYCERHGKSDQLKTCLWETRPEVDWPFLNHREAQDVERNSREALFQGLAKEIESLATSTDRNPQKALDLLNELKATVLAL